MRQVCVTVGMVVRLCFGLIFHCSNSILNIFPDTLRNIIRITLNDQSWQLAPAVLPPGVHDDGVGLLCPPPQPDSLSQLSDEG